MRQLLPNVCLGLALIPVYLFAKTSFSYYPLLAIVAVVFSILAIVTAPKEVKDVDGRAKGDSG